METLTTRTRTTTTTTSHPPPPATASENENDIFSPTSSLSVSSPLDPPSSSATCCIPATTSPCGGIGLGGGGGGRNRKRMKTSTSGDTDDIELAKQMYELSVQEREKVYEDVHGVSKPPVETIEFVDSVVKQLDSYVDKISIKKKKAYSRALFLYPQLENDTEWKLGFLRAEHFDPKSAAQRMVNYYEQKRILWGDSKLVKKLTLNDLSDADKTMFNIGGAVTLPTKDSSGRNICFFNGANLDFNHMKHGMDIDNFVRALWYVVEVAGSTKESQQRGVCTIMYPSGYDIFSTSNVALQRMVELTMKTGYLFKCLPIRISSSHFCYNDPRLKPFVNTIRMAVGKSTMLRLRTYQGSDVEMEYYLMPFGIQSSGLLCNSHESTSIYDEYIQRREEIERNQALEELKQQQLSSKPPEYVPFPNCKDVLIGRGRPYRDYVGNITWNNIIDDHMDQYYVQSKTRFEKTCVTMDVIKLIRTSSEVRYILERIPSIGWKILDDINAREKAAVAFQNRGRTKQKKTPNNKLNIAPSLPE